MPQVFAASSEVTRRSLVALLAVTAGSLFGCASAPGANLAVNPGLGDDRQAARLHAALSNGAAQTGLASWYGAKFHGRRTANGETFDMNGISAAHKTLPFGTVLRVDNLDNGRSLKVRVNDRGPFIKGRILDLSRGAAMQIGMLTSGVARVELTLIAWPEETESRESPLPSSAHGPWVQAGAFRELGRAMALESSLQQHDSRFAVYSEAGWHRVQARLVTSTEASKLIQKLRKRGIEAVAVRD